MNPEYEPLLPGIAFAGYRSFAGWQEILLPTKVTVLAGINNSGKSNVLRFLQGFLPTNIDRRGRPTSPKIREIVDIDTPRGFSAVRDFEIGFPTLLGEAQASATDSITSIAIDEGSAEALRAALMHIMSRDKKVFWSQLSRSSNNGDLVPSSHQLSAAMRQWPEWDTRFTEVLDILGGGTRAAASTMRQLLASIPIPTMPPVATIANSRRVEARTDGSTDPEWSSGRGIIEELFKLQNPTHSEWDVSQSSWSAINRFVQAVLGDPDARLTIPHNRTAIQVATVDRVLPLDSLGSGVEQVVVLAAAATVVSKHLVCIEEPETNLHPLLQKKLLRYLTDETDNQYVIATHSSHFLDDSRATAYNVQLTDLGTTVNLARRPHELVQICNDLGYRPSDLQQANCIVWVEGPSDRIYVRCWLELADPGLTEGIDYSVMFYGGKLLSHLSASDEALNDFISLRRLNRSSAILIDSDRTNPEGQINATKQRIQEEYDSDGPAPGFAWVTAGYTIENYIPNEVLTGATEQAHPNILFTPVNEWTNPFPKRRGTQFDKIAIAQAVAERLQPAHLDTLDLRKEIVALRDFIRSANGHSTAPHRIL